MMTEKWYPTCQAEEMLYKERNDRNPKIQK